MKNSGKITIVLFVFLTAGSLSLSAQRGMRGMRTDTARFKRPAMDMLQRTDSIRSGMMRSDNMRMHMHDMRPPMFPMHEMRRPFRYAMRPGRDIWRPVPDMRYRGMDRLPGMGFGVPGIRSLDNIPDLTDKQKKAIEELRQKQQSEMLDLRKEMQDKMKELRDSHRSKLRDLLTDEQKKLFDDNSPAKVEK
jgi:hypothetical protein